MSYSFVRIRRDGHSGTIVLQRPEKRNALSRPLLTEIESALNDLHADGRVRVVILTGAGSAFCAGIDLAEMWETSRGENPHEKWYDDVTQFRDLLDTMWRYPKPIVAAVNGPALGAGAGLVLAADIVIASPSACFGFPEPRRGLAVGTVAPLLVFRVGGGRAAGLLLSGEMMTAERACSLGVYHELVNVDLVWARAHELAGQCARGAPEALALTKRMLNETIGENLTTLLAAGAALSAAGRTTEAAAEGIAAFLQKRPPEWP